MAEITQEVIREFAYYVWEDAGRPEGKDVEIWLSAEYILRAQKWVTYSRSYDIAAHATKIANDAIFKEEDEKIISVLKANIGWWDRLKFWISQKFS
jgi:hypothetical protein